MGGKHPILRPKALRKVAKVHKYHRRKLDKLIGLAADEDFFHLLWAVHALQSDYSIRARSYLDPQTIPLGAATTDMTSEFSIHKWEIETLANELMTVAKLNQVGRGPKRTLRHNSFQACAECANRLRDLENAEYREHKKPKDILVEMGRIAARQFDWQRGYVNIPQFYRNAFIYGQGKCADYFAKKNGITINRFSEIGFMLYVSFTNFPVVKYAEGWHTLGITRQEFDVALRLIAKPIQEAKKLAQATRSGNLTTADKPSILRQFPCIRFGADFEIIRAPLPELILERVTSGVFYDVVDGEGDVRNDYGSRFEEYCLRHLSDSLPELDWEREFLYRSGKKEYRSPDIICMSGNLIKLVLECKASRMSHAAMFGIDPTGARGYDDLSKAVFQLWRFFYHLRLGHVGKDISADAVGVVLTLDNWLIFSHALLDHVLKTATEMAKTKEPGISNEDMKPVIFVAATELEHVLSRATAETFLKAVSTSSTSEFRGWRLNGIFDRVIEDHKKQKREYPYKNELGKLLPWWDKVEAAKQERGT